MFFICSSIVLNFETRYDGTEVPLSIRSGQAGTKEGAEPQLRNPVGQI
jgi:hypothetical protein